MTDGTPISGLGPHHGRRQQETSPFRVRRTVGFSLNNAPGLENRWTGCQSPAPRRHTAATESQHPVSQPTQPPPASLPSPQPSDQTPLGGDRTGARLRDTSPPSPTTQPRRTPPDRVGRCNPCTDRRLRGGSAKRKGLLVRWFCAYYSGRGSGTWVRRCVSRPWLGDVRGWDDDLWDARPRLLLPATAKMLRIDTLVARNHIRSPGRLLACWIQDTS